MCDPRKMKSSNLWNCFEDSGDSVNKVAVCNLCKTKLSYKSSTTNLKKHLERKHPTVLFVSTKTPSSQTLDSNPGPSTSSNLDRNDQSTVPTAPALVEVVNTNRVVSQTTIATFVKKKCTPTEKKG